MKTVILCGGKGTRLSEETVLKPKPMVTVGGRPILSHIIDIYNKYGCNEFVLALGYKGDVIKDYFLNYFPHNSDFMVDVATGQIEYFRRHNQSFKVYLMETGEDTLTGGRLLRLKPFLKDTGTFMLTYGDGLADINIQRLLKFHKEHGRLCTVSAVRPKARFGAMSINKNGLVAQFEEKAQFSEGWINGGFFVMEPKVFDYLENDETILERAPLERLSQDGQLMAFTHDGFWQCMDTVRDREVLESLWASGQAPWK